MDRGTSERTSQANETIIENNDLPQRDRYSILFPYHCFKVGEQNHSRTPPERLLSVSPTTTLSTSMFRTLLFNKFNMFPKVCAMDTKSNNDDNIVKVDETRTADNTVTTGGGNEQLHITQRHVLEALARAYISQESGRERVLAIFRNDHKGESSPEMFYLKVAIIQAFVMSFFLKYVPSWKQEKEDFIREHNATAFRTHIEAAISTPLEADIRQKLYGDKTALQTTFFRKMNDYAALMASVNAAKFAIKITAFCAGFLTLTQVIASYRNKTSVMEYTVAAGVVGGLGRIQLGPKGFVAGAVVGTVLGTIFGGVTSVLLRSFDLAEENRHFENIISRLEVEKSIVGESGFKQKMKNLAVKLESTPSAS